MTGKYKKAFPLFRAAAHKIKGCFSYIDFYGMLAKYRCTFPHSRTDAHVFLHDPQTDALIPSLCNFISPPADNFHTSLELTQSWLIDDASLICNLSRRPVIVLLDFLLDAKLRR